MLQTIDLLTSTIYFYYFINPYSQQGKTEMPTTCIQHTPRGDKKASIHCSEELLPKPMELFRVDTLQFTEENRCC